MSEAPCGPTAAAYAPPRVAPLGRCGSYTRAARPGHAFGSRQVRHARARECRRCVPNPPPASVPIARIDAVEQTKVSRAIRRAPAACGVFRLDTRRLPDLGRG